MTVEHHGWGKNYITENEDVEITGVRVLVVNGKEREHIRGKVVLALQRYDLPDELLARGVQMYHNKRGRDTALVFHPESRMTELAKKEGK